MTRRVALPGADELFRSTAPASQPAAPPAEPPAEPTPPPAPVSAAAFGGRAEAQTAEPEDELAPPPPVRRRPRPVGERRPTGRERHEEKITVYCSAEELFEIERARLTLRGEYGLAADRGRIVREALAMVLSDFESRGDQSVLVRRLRGR